MAFKRKITSKSGTNYYLTNRYVQGEREIVVFKNRKPKYFKLAPHYFPIRTKSDEKILRAGLKEDKY